MFLLTSVMKMLLFRSRHFTFLSRRVGYVKKTQIDKKAMVDFKIYDVTEWTKRNKKTTHIVQYLSEIWSVNRIKH